MNYTPIHGVIKSSTQYETVLVEIEALMNTVEPNTPEGDRLELLILLADTYEQEHFPITAPDPIEAIKVVMLERDLKQIDLVEIIGAESRVSEILHRKRRLTLDMIRNISTSLNISLGTLVQEYELVG